MTASLYRKLFENDQMCIKCGYWYTPLALVDEVGICTKCKSSNKRTVQKARFYFAALDMVYNKMIANYTPGDNDTSYIYFIMGRITKRVKVGYTSGHPYDRLRDLQVGSPDPLHLLGVIEAPQSFEKELHDVLAPFRTHGEWFEMPKELTKFITRVSLKYIPAKAA